MIEKLTILVAIIMLPVIPAYLLFKLLPSSAVTTGKLAGLQVNVGGAFGGYVALTVFVAAFYTKTLAPASYEPWTVTGTVKVDGAVDPARMQVTLRPPKIEVAEGNRFLFNVGLDSGAQRNAILSFTAPGYEPAGVALFGDSGWGAARTVKPKVSLVNHTIELGEVVLARKTALQPNAEAQEITR